jgi:hypothetical protein
MKTRTLLILSGLLAVLIIAGIITMRMNTRNAPDSVMGAYLFRELPVNDIELIFIEGAGESVRLEKKSGKWVVGNRSGYPADFTMITDFVRALRDSKTGRSFEASDASMAGMSLHDPSQDGVPDESKGIRVRLLDKDEKALADLVLGSRRNGSAGGPSGGRYVRFESSSTVYLVNETLELCKPYPAEWIKKDLLDIEASEIKAVACRKDGTFLYRFERGEGEKNFRPLIFPPGEKVDRQALKKLSGALASFRIKDVAPASGMDETAFGTCLEYSLFDGRKISVCREDKGNGKTLPMVRVSAAIDTTHTAEQHSGETTPDDRIDEETAVETAKVQEIFSGWIFELSSWRFDSLVTDPAELAASEE